MKRLLAGLAFKSSPDFRSLLIFADRFCDCDPNKALARTCVGWDFHWNGNPLEMSGERELIMLFPNGRLSTDLNRAIGSL